MFYQKHHEEGFCHSLERLNVTLISLNAMSHTLQKQTNNEHANQKQTHKKWKRKLEKPLLKKRTTYIA